MRPKQKDALLYKLEREVMDILKKSVLTDSDQLKLKAIEAGAKVLMLRHRIKDKDGEDGDFFARSRGSK